MFSKGYGVNMLEIGKHKAKILKWVNAAVSKDKARPVLAAVHFDGRTEASDGFRMHIANEQIDTGLMVIDKIAGEYVASRQIQGDYPNILDYISKREPMLEIYVNPRFLRETLTGLAERPTLLRFYGKDHPFEVAGKIIDEDEETDVFALIMPMYSEEELWRPK